MALKWENQNLQPAQKLICKLMNKLQYLQYCTLAMFGNYLLMAFIPILNVRTWKTFFIKSPIFIKTLMLLLGQENTGELAFLDTLLKVITE